MRIEMELEKLGLTLPEPPKPAGLYVGATVANGFAFSAGQGPSVKGEIRYRGKVGRDLTVEEGFDAARISVLNCLAQFKAVLGDLDKIERILKVIGFVNSADGFRNQPAVLNGASELLLKLWGENGKHARAAVAVSVEGWIPVEIEVIAKVRE